MNEEHDNGADRRYASSLQAVVWREGIEHFATIADMSGGGMLLAIEAREGAEAPTFTAGEEIDLRWSMQVGSQGDADWEVHTGTDDLGLHLCAEIRNIRAEPGCLSVGIRFSTMSESTWLAIASVLEDCRILEERRCSNL